MGDLTICTLRATSWRQDNQWPSVSLPSTIAMETSLPACSGDGGREKQAGQRGVHWSQPWASLRWWLTHLGWTATGRWNGGPAGRCSLQKCTALHCRQLYERGANRKREWEKSLLEVIKTKMVISNFVRVSFLCKWIYMCVCVVEALWSVKLNSLFSLNTNQCQSSGG